MRHVRNAHGLHPRQTPREPLRATHTVRQTAPLPLGSGSRVNRTEVRAPKFVSRWLIPRGSGDGAVLCDVSLLRVLDVLLWMSAPSRQGSDREAAA